MIGPHISSEPIVTGHRHIILKGFEETDILPFGGLLEPLRTDPGIEVLMTYIPQFPIYPPETAWMRTPKTDIPGLIINSRHQQSHIAFLPADIDRQFGLYNLPDHGNLLANLFRWAAKDAVPLTAEGAGSFDYHLYQQSDHLILHVVNLTNPAAWHQPMHEMIPSGPQKIKIKLPNNVKGRSLNLLVSNQKLSTRTTNGFTEFEIKSIMDHEVVVIS